MIHIPKFQFDANDWIEGNNLWGKKLAKLIRQRLAEDVAKSGVKPGLAVLLVGDDQASQVYVSHKEKACKELGFTSIIRREPASLSQEKALEIAEQWNADPSLHGILVQLPLPSQIDERTVLQAIKPEKDVDGFHFENIGRLHAKSPGIVSCTPLGIMVMLQEAAIDLVGKKAVVLGRSNIVGKPMAQLLMDAGQCTVTVCHSKTKDIASYVREADVVVSAMGVLNIVNPQDIKKGAVIIDVGMHRTENGLQGDLDYDQIKERASYITPVPGGVGPMTIAMLMYNTYHNAVQTAKVNTDN